MIFRLCAPWMAKYIKEWQDVEIPGMQICTAAPSVTTLVFFLHTSFIINGLTGCFRFVQTFGFRTEMATRCEIPGCDSINVSDHVMFVNKF